MNFRDYPSEALREISRRAGVASGKARRKKRAKIEREKIRNKAIQEQHRENWQTIERAVAIYNACAKKIVKERGLKF